MRKLKNKIIGITLGDPSGIGPEVISRSIRKSAIRKLAKKFIIIGSKAVYRRYCRKKFENCAFIDTLDVSSRQYVTGKPNRYSAQASLEYLKIARRLLSKHKIDALVTGPVSKERICSLGYKFQGHTEFLAKYFRVKNFAMMFVSHSLRTIVITRHIPLNQVSKKISSLIVEKNIKLAHTSLKNHFRLKSPRIAICGLNPHAGERGAIGCEEVNSIIPAISNSKKRGINVEGPFPADTIFCPNNACRYDVIIAMYHDQGIIPIKTLHFNKLVNITIGLPFIRTSPAHGTAFGIAGKNIADPSSMEEAIRLAAKLSS